MSTGIPLLAGECTVGLHRPSTVDAVRLAPTSAAAAFVIIQNLLKLRLFGGVGAEGEIEPVVAGPLFDVPLAGMGDPQAPIEPAEGRVRRPQGQRLLEQDHGARRILRDQLLVPLVEQLASLRLVVGPRPRGRRGRYRRPTPASRASRGLLRRRGSRGRPRRLAYL